MNSPERSCEDLADDWLSTGALATFVGPGEVKTYPKRSELRRAEARAAIRRGADRRPAGGRPPGAAGTHGPPAPAGSARTAEASRRPPPPGFAPARVPFAVSPTPAVLPIRQTSTQTRPAGINLPRQVEARGVDAFHKPAPDTAPMVPIAVPAGVPLPPTAPPELAAPVTPGLDPAAWGLDIEAVPATGRRRGTEESEPARRRLPSVLGLPTLPVSSRLLGKGKAGAARLLVLALVVGAEGVAVTSLTGPTHTTSAQPAVAGIAGAFEYQASNPGRAVAPAKESAALVGGSAASAGQSASAGLSAAGSTAGPAVIDPVAAQAFETARQASSKAMVAAALAQAKAAAARVKEAADRRAKVMRNSQRDPKGVARELLAERGWGSGQYSCLVSLWNRESMWNYRAYNGSSGAYGIPQALPGSKMASAGSDWRTNPVTQIKWGLSYISSRYGTPCGAWSHSQATGWY